MVSNMDDLVSIIMPNYNGEKFISKSIESVIVQTYKNWELIICDDCSKDKSVEIIKKYCDIDERVKLYLNEKNSGAAVTRNNAIEKARGRFIAFLDSDDLWVPEKLEKQIKFMIENNYSFTCSNYYVIDENDELISDFRPKKGKYNRKDILKSNSIGCLTVIIDKNVIDNVNMPTAAIKREDFACWLDVLKKVEFCFNIDEFLAKYRKHTSVSSNKFKMMKYQWNVYRKVEKINFFSSCYYLLSWALRGIFKY